MKKLGIIVAQEEEARPLNDILESIDNEKKIKESTGYDEIRVKVSGVGKLNAMYAAMELIQAGYSTILNIGVSAGRGDLKIGDIVRVKESYDGDFDISVFDHPQFYVPEVGNSIDLDCMRVMKHMEGRGMNIKSLPCFSISYFLEGDITTDIKDYVVDMELYGLAYLGYKAQANIHSFKCISDTDNTGKSPEEYASTLNKCSEILAKFLINYVLVP